MNEDVVGAFGLSDAQIEAVCLGSRLGPPGAGLPRRYGALDLAGKTVIVIDDGLATGASMRTARQFAEKPPARPDRAGCAYRSPLDTASHFEREVDEAICLMAPEPFYAIGQWYVDFSQTSDEEVVSLLRAAGGFGRRPDRPDSATASGSASRPRGRRAPRTPALASAGRGRVR